MNTQLGRPARRWAGRVAFAFAVASSVPALASVLGCSDASAPIVETARRAYQPEKGVRAVSVNGNDVAYFEVGSGPLVVLLHGFPDTAHTWDAAAPLLAASGHRVVAPFLSGYAPSGIQPTDMTVEMLGRQIVGLVRALGEDHAILVGHDWGAFGAYAAAAFEPRLVDKLVTIAIPHPIALAKHPEVATPQHFVELTRPDALAMAEADDFIYLDTLVARWSPTWRVPKGELDPVKNAFSVPGSLNAALGYYRGFYADLPAALFEPVSVPTLTFRGTKDGSIDPAPWADQKAAFRGAFELVELPVGHFVHREAEDAFMTKLLTFIDE